jgi:hypothetical protein
LRKVNPLLGEQCFKLICIHKPTLSVPVGLLAINTR